MIVAATGHRLHLLPGYRGDGSSTKLRIAVVNMALATLDRWQPSEVISGMATGWDMSVAMAAMILNIPFRAYIPFHGQHEAWGAADQSAYRDLLEEATEIRVISDRPGKGAYIKRDEAMVDDASAMLALYNGDPATGTGYTVEYAHGWLVPVHNVWDEFLEALQQSALAPHGN